MGFGWAGPTVVAGIEFTERVRGQITEYHVCSVHSVVFCFFFIHCVMTCAAGFIILNPIFKSSYLPNFKSKAGNVMLFLCSCVNITKCDSSVV